MAGMPSSRRSRDLYKTPSPPPTPPRARTKTGKIEDWFTATKLIKSYQPRRSLKNAVAAAELRHTSPILESGFSTPGSICSVPSLSTTPNTVRSSNVPSLSTTPNSVRSLEGIPTPKIQGGIHLRSRKLKSESPSMFLSSDVGTTFSEWHVESPTSQVWKHSMSNFQNATALPYDAIPGERISQPTYKVDHPANPRHNVAQFMGGPATPKRQVMRPYNSQTRSLTRLAKKDETTRSQYGRQPLSMWSIVASVVLLQRYMKGKLGHQGKSSSYQEKATVPRAMFQESTSTLLISKNAGVSSWLLQSEDSNSSSDTCSVDSLEGDSTEHDSEAGELPWCGKKIDTRIIHWERRVVLEDIMKLAQHTLSHLPQATITKTLAAVRALFESWASQLASSTHAANGDTSSSFNFSQAGGNSERTTSNSRSQKRPLDEDDEEPSNNGNNNPRKRQNLNGTLDAECRRMWACPFYRREPHRYCDITELGDFRKCAKSPGFPELHRVKSHLQKCHSSPIHCKRCYTVVKDDDELETHQIKIPACDVKPRQRIEGLTSEQKKLLQTRDRSSEEERWNTMYKICFPNDKAIPSPYYVHYSREVVELRRNIFEIIQAEAQSPDGPDLGRLSQRVEAVFDAQKSAHAEPPGILTPSSSDTSHTSNTSGGSSNRAITREICQRTPSVTRTTRQLASATGFGNVLQVPDISDLDEQSDSAMTDVRTSMFPYVSHFSGSDDFPAFDENNECAPVHFRGFSAPMPQLDSEQHQISQEYYDFHDFDFPQQDEDSILDPRG